MKYQALKDQASSDVGALVSDVVTGIGVTLLVAGPTLLPGCAAQINTKRAQDYVNVPAIVQYIENHPSAGVEQFTDFVTKDQKVRRMNKSSSDYDIQKLILEPVEVIDGQTTRLRLIIDGETPTEVRFEYTTGGVTPPRLKTTYRNADGKDHTILEYEDITKDGFANSRIDGNPEGITVKSSYSAPSVTPSGDLGRYMSSTARDVPFNQLPAEQRAEMKQKYRTILKAVAKNAPKTNKRTRR